MIYKLHIIIYTSFVYTIKYNFRNGLTILFSLGKYLIVAYHDGILPDSWQLHCFLHPPESAAPKEKEWITLTICSTQTKQSKFEMHRNDSLHFARPVFFKICFTYWNLSQPRQKRRNEKRSQFIPHKISNPNNVGLAFPTSGTSTPCKMQCAFFMSIKSSFQLAHRGQRHCFYVHSHGYNTNNTNKLSDFSCFTLSA